MNKMQDEYTKSLERSFELSFSWGKLNLLNDVLDQEFKKKNSSNQLKTFIFTPFACIGLIKAYDRYNIKLPQKGIKRIAIIAIPGMFIVGLFQSWLESDVKFKEMRSILAQRYEQQLLEQHPRLKEEKIKYSLSGPPSPYQNRNSYQQSNYGNNYNQSFQQPDYNPGNAQNYQPSSNTSQFYQKPNFSTENTQPYQQPNGNPDPYQRPNLNMDRSNPQAYSYQSNPINRNPHEQPNFNAPNNAQPFQQSNFNTQEPNLSNSSPSYYQKPNNWQNTSPWNNERENTQYQQPNNWQNNNPWNSDRENTIKGTDFSDGKNDLSSQSAQSAQLNPDENPYLATMPKRYPNNKPTNPPSKGSYI